MPHYTRTFLALILFSAAASTTLAVLLPQQRQPAAKPAAAEAAVAAKKAPLPRPPLKKEWQGRWQSNPFADTVALEMEVMHKAGKYEIKVARKVAALMEQLTIRSFHNGMGRDFPYIARLTFHKKDDTEAVVWVGEGPFLSGLGGEMAIDPAFLVALGREFCDEKGKALDLLKPHAAPPVKKLPPLTIATLQKGFEFFAVDYFRGDRLRKAGIMDRKMLDKLGEALTVVEQGRDKAPAEGSPQKVRFIPKGGTEADAQYGSILDNRHLVLGNLGRLTVNPSFVKTLNEQLSQLEGRAVEVLGINPPPPEQLRREQTLREKLVSARRLRIRTSDGEEIIVDRRPELEQLFEKLTWVETPIRPGRLERTPGFLEVTTAKEEVIRLTYLKIGRNQEKVSVAPDGHLMDVSGYGPMWLDSRFRAEIQLYAEKWQNKEQERRSEETFRLVCDDLPSFLQQGYNVVVWYRQGKDEFVECLTAEQSWPLLKIIRNAKVEKISWTKERWDNEVKRLEMSGAGTLVLMPGVGFSMLVYITDEKELLLPNYGRLHLPSPIVDAVRRAVESEDAKAQTIQVLPR